MSNHARFTRVRLGARVLFACLVVASFHASAGTVSVCSVTSVGTPSGSGTWASPLDLQTALGNTACDEIWVKAGTYKPTSGTDRRMSFTLDRKVAVYGGFAGGETQRIQRNPATHVSVLSGDIGTASDASDNSFHVIYIAGDAANKIGNDTVLDGFTITAGNANYASQPDFNGGGLLCIGEGAGGQCSPTLRQLNFVDNHASSAGGAMEIYCWIGASATPVMSDLTFSNNSAGSIGGALHHGNECKAAFALDRVTFDGNSAARGGAMAAGYSSGVALHDVTFTNNAASKNGGAMQNSSIESVVLDHVSFIGNSAIEFGGAMYNRSTGAGKTSTLTLTDVSFDNNSAVSSAGNGQGGALHNEAFGADINLILNRVTLSNNSADFAGAIHNTTSYVDGNLTATLGNVTFSNNSATSSSRDMTSSAQKGSVDIALRNVTLDSGGSGYYSLINSGNSTGSVNVTLSNVILWDSTPSLPIINSGANASTQIDHSIVVRSNGSGATWTASLGTDGGGNIDADPMLGALADNGGYTQTMLPAGGSPAIDIGDAATCAAVPVGNRDQRGGTRPHGAQCDIGAIEVGADVDTIFANGFD